MAAMWTCPNPNCRQAIPAPEQPSVEAVTCPHCEWIVMAPPPEPGELATTQTLPASPALAETGPASPPVPVAPELPASLGRFEIRARLGEGAFGVVYRAYDPLLDREVALKVAKPRQLATPDLAERFAREARSAAQLRHPHIVPLFEMGQDGEHFYLVSGFVAGRTLAEVIKEKRPDFRAAAGMVLHLAEALAYAHKVGIVHRDIKPSNVMVDAAGDPLVLDFGLAARHEGEERLTQEGTLLGTPLYLAPEQAAGAAVAASDQYSLGCVLYELLTGQPPFNSGTVEMLITQHQKEEPPRPRSKNRKIPRDLETICLKCLAKKPGERYTDCQALADDLRRWLEGQAIKARRLRMYERLARWAKREPKLATALAFLLLLLIAATVSSVFLYRVNEQLTGEIKEREEAVRRSDRHYQVSLYSKTFDRALLRWHGGDVAGAQETMIGLDPLLQSWEYGYLERLCQRKRLFLEGTETQKWEEPGSELTALAISPDREWIATGVLGSVKIRHYRTREVARTFSCPGSIRTLAFSSDGKRYAAWGRTPSDPGPGIGRVWDAETGQELHAMNHQTRWADRGFITGNCRGVVTLEGIDSHTCNLWDMQTGAKENLPIEGRIELVCVACGPDGKDIVAGGALHEINKPPLDCSGQVIYWFLALDGKRQSRQFSTGSSYVSAICLNLAKEQIVSGSADGTVCILDATNGKILFTMKGHEKKVTGLCCSADGQWIVTGSTDTTVRVWDANTGKEVHTLRGHTAEVVSVSVSEDGSRIGSAGGGVHVWDRLTGRTITTLEHSAWVKTVAISPNGSKLLGGADISGGAESPSRLVMWEVPTGKIIRSIEGQDNQCVKKLAFSQDNQTIAVAYDDRVICWDRTSGDATLQRSVDNVLALVFPQGNQNLLAIRRTAEKPSGSVEVVDLTADKVLFTTPVLGKSETVRATLTPDCRFLIAGCDSTVWVWDVVLTKEICSFPGVPGAISSVAISPDSSKIACTTATTRAKRAGTIHVWDRSTKRALFSIPGHENIEFERLGGMAFSADGQRLFTFVEENERTRDGELQARKFQVRAGNAGVTQLFGLGDSHSVRVWDANTGQELLALLPSGIITCWAFDQNANALVVADATDRFVKSWESALPEQTRVFRGHRKEVRRVTFSPDGGKLVSFADSQSKPITNWGLGEAFLWDVATGDHLRPADTGTAEPSNFEFSPDSGHLLCVGREEFRDKNEVQVRAFVRVSHAETGNRTMEFTGVDTEFSNFLFNSNGNYIVGIVQKKIRDGQGQVEDGIAQVYDVKTGKAILHLTDPEYHPYRATYHPNGHWIATADVKVAKDRKRDIAQHRITIWDATSGKKIRTWKGQVRSHQSFFFTEDGNRLVMGISVYDPVTGEELFQFRGPGNLNYEHVAFIRGGKHFAGISNLNNVLVCDESTGMSVSVINTNATCISISPDGRHLVTGSPEGVVRFWDLTALKGNMPIPVRSFPAHSGSVNSVAFSPDGKRLATGGADRLIKLWDASALTAPAK